MDPKRPKDIDDAVAEEIIGDRDVPFDDDDRLRHQAARRSAGRTDLSDEELREDDLADQDEFRPENDRT